MTSIFTTATNKPARSSAEPSLAGEVVVERASLTVVSMDERAELNGEGLVGVPEAEMDIDLEADVALAAPTSTLKKRGRPSLSSAATPGKSIASKTPRSSKSAAAPKSAGRSTGKRRATEPELESEAESEAEATPVRKRGRPARSTAAVPSARRAAMAAKKPTRGRPKSTTVSTFSSIKVSQSLNMQHSLRKRLSSASPVAPRRSPRLTRPRMNSKSRRLWTP